MFGHLIIIIIVHFCSNRYVLARFNESFAEEYEQEPARLPDAWLHVTREEALESLREASALSSAAGQ